MTRPNPAAAAGASPPERSRFDLLLTGATVLTADETETVVQDAVVGVRDGRIALVAEHAGAARDLVADRTIPLAGHVICPGFVNAHTHAILTMVRGVAEDLGFAPAYTRAVPHAGHLDPGSALALARLGVLEAALSGSTVMVDTYAHADATGRAIAEIGVRGFVGPFIHDVDLTRLASGDWTVDRARGDATLAAALDFADRWDGAAGGRLRAILAPHAPDTCSQALLAEIAGQTGAPRLPVTIHLEQSRVERERVLAREGCSPTRLLDRTGLLDRRVLLAHALFVAGAEHHLLARAPITVAHVPRGNALGGAMAPTPALRNAGVRLALATDNMHGDMVEALRWALAVARVQVGGVSDGWRAGDALRMATLHGAAGLGLDGELGTVEVGKRADLVALDYRRAHLVPARNPAGNLVHLARGGDVRLVLVDGEPIVEDGRSTRVDEQRVLHEGRRAARRVWERVR